jgi:hypothetical protein
VYVIMETLFCSPTFMKPLNTCSLAMVCLIVAELLGAVEPNDILLFPLQVLLITLMAPLV